MHGMYCMMKVAGSGIVKSALDVFDREPMYKRPVSSTVGRAMSPLVALALGTTAPFRPGAYKDSERLKKLLEHASADEDLDDLAVSLGGGRPIEELKRIFKNPRTSLLTKAYGSASWPIVQLMTVLQRADHYDPFAHMVVQYNDDPAVLAHELGHARDFAGRKYPGLYTAGRVLPPIALYQEGRASKLALKDILESAKTDGEISEEGIRQARRANRVLSGGFGSYAGNLLSSLGLPIGPIGGALVGQASGAVSQPFTPAEHRDLLKKQKGKKGKPAAEDDDDDKQDDEQELDKAAAIRGRTGKV